MYKNNIAKNKRITQEAKSIGCEIICPEVNVFFDTETNGLPREHGSIQPSIMQIVIFDNNGNSIFSEYVIPQDGLVSGTFIHGISQSTLDKNNALTMRETCELIKSTLRDKYGRQRINWFAYNAFGFDQSVLEAGFKAVNIRMPNNWYFTDLLPIVRECYPKLRPNFKLGTVYRVLNDVTDEDFNKLELHNADTDVMCLHSIYLKIIQNNPDIFRELFEKYTRPLLSDPKILESNISVINGYNSTIPFHKYGFNKVNDFMKVFNQSNCDVILFKAVLLNIGLKCNGFIINNICDNINTINILLKQ
jgi:DNA polymerase III epsilon subunit-like protein